MKRIVLAAAATAAFGTFAGVANAGNIVWNQGFETDTSGWFDGGSYGGITRVASGTGVTSASGGYHAQVTQTDSGPYSFFDGSRNTWPGGMTASIDVYLDTSWAAGAGFDYSVAAWGTDGSHQRDFIFHVTQDVETGTLLVGGSNNSSFDPIGNLEDGNHYEVTASGWFTLQHVFRDAGDGTLAVDMNLVDSNGNVVFTETRNNNTDILGVEVGGNGYGWFTHIDIAGGINVDNHTLEVIPLPAASAMAGLGLLAVGTRRRRRL